MEGGGNLRSREELDGDDSFDVLFAVRERLQRRGTSITVSAFRAAKPPIETWSSWGRR
jgi:hypothetical protein